MLEPKLRDRKSPRAHTESATETMHLTRAVAFAVRGAPATLAWYRPDSLCRDRTAAVSLPSVRTASPYSSPEIWTRERTRSHAISAVTFTLADEIARPGRALFVENSCRAAMELAGDSVCAPAIVEWRDCVSTSRNGHEDSDINKFYTIQLTAHHSAGEAATHHSPVRGRGSSSDDGTRARTAEPLVTKAMNRWAARLAH